MREGAHVSVLHHVLGLGVVAQDAAGEAIELAVVRLHDGADGGLITGEGAAHQFGVAGVGGSDIRYAGLTHDVHQ